MNTPGVLTTLFDIALFDVRFASVARKVSKAWCKGVQEWVQGRMEELWYSVCKGRGHDNTLDMDKLVAGLYGLAKWRRCPLFTSLGDPGTTEGRLEQLQQHPFPSNMTLHLCCGGSYVQNLPSDIKNVSFMLRTLFPNSRVSTALHTCGTLPNCAFADKSRARDKDECTLCLLVGPSCSICKEVPAWIGASFQEKVDVADRLSTTSDFLNRYGFHYHAFREWAHCQVCTRWHCKGCASVSYFEYGQLRGSVCVQCTHLLPLRCCGCDVSLSNLVKEKDLRVLVTDIYRSALACSTCINRRCKKCNPKKIFAPPRRDTKKGKGQGLYQVLRCSCIKEIAPDLPSSLMGSGLLPPPPPPPPSPPPSKGPTHPTTDKRPVKKARRN